MLAVTSITFAYPRHATPSMFREFQCSSAIRNGRGLKMCILKNDLSDLRLSCEDDDGRPTKWQIRADWVFGRENHNGVTINGFHTTESNDYGQYLYMDWGQVAEEARRINVICSVENGREQVEGTLNEGQPRF